MGDGTIMTEFKDIKSDTRNHFSELYTQREEENHLNINTILEHIPALFTREENWDLIRPISEA